MIIFIESSVNYLIFQVDLCVQLQAVTDISWLAFRTYGDI